MRETFRLIIKQDLLRTLEQLAIPILMIWGTKDPITPLWIAQKAHRIKPESELIIIPNERHMVSVTQPKEFVNHVRSFLNTI